MLYSRHAVVALAAVCLYVFPARAESAIIGPGVFDFNGTFTTYNQEEYFLLELSSPMLFEARTTSYAAGGFDPVLSLFDSAGDFVLQNDDEDPDFAAQKFDALIMLTLLPGSYAAALTQTPNFFEPQFGRFGYAGVTCDQSGAFASCEDPFQGRTGLFAVQISLAQADVPEPGFLALAGIGIAALAGRRRRRKPQ